MWLKSLELGSDLTQRRHVECPPFRNHDMRDTRGFQERLIWTRWCAEPCENDNA
jgi:hypothetical protein